jgi:hypothetical protein
MSPPFERLESECQRLPRDLSYQYIPGLQAQEALSSPRLRCPLHPFIYCRSLLLQGLLLPLELRCSSTAGEWDVVSVLSVIGYDGKREGSIRLPSSDKTPHKFTVLPRLVHLFDWSSKYA